MTAPALDRRYSISPGHAEALTSDLSLAYSAPFARMVTAGFDDVLVLPIATDLWRFYRLV